MQETLQVINKNGLSASLTFNSQHRVFPTVTLTLQPFKDEAQTALFKGPVRNAQ